MSEEKCFCHLNGYQVKDSVARKSLETLDTKVNTLDTKVNTLDTKVNLLNKKYIIISDSYGEGYTPAGTVTSFIDLIKAKISNTIYSSAIGGSGFVNGDTKFLAQLQTLSASISNKDEITDIYVIGGYNDKSGNESSISSAIDSFLTYAKTNYVNAKVHIGFVGWDNNPDNYNALRLVDCFYSSNAAKHGNGCYISNLKYVLHDVGLMSTDGFHPNASGQNKIANYLMQYMNGNNISVIYPFKQISTTLQDNWNGTIMISEEMDNEIISLKGLACTLNRSTSKEVNCDYSTLYPIYKLNDGYLVGTNDWNTNFEIDCIFKFDVAGGQFRHVPCTVVIKNRIVHLLPKLLLDDGTTYFINTHCSQIIIPAFNITFSTMHQ